MNWSDLHVAAAPALALCVALGLAALVKAHLLSRLLGAPVNVWRWALVWAAILATVVGIAATHVPEWAELIFGIPLILGAYCAVIWSKGFGPEDRELFRKARRSEEHTSELQSLMRSSYAVFCLKKKRKMR